MTTEAGFVQALRENPDDDVARLIFADWLDDQGDPRGEFFRLQVELARWVPDRVRRQELYRRCEALLATHAGDWLGPLAQECVEVYWERGQPHLTLSVTTLARPDFLADVGRLLDHAIVGRVRLIDAGAYRGALPSFPVFQHLPHLHLELLDFEDVHLADLLANPSFRNVRALSLANNRLTDASVHALLASRVMESLRELDLRNNRLHDDSLWALTETELDFDLRGNALGPAALDALTARRALRHSGAERVQNSLGMEFARIPAGSYLHGSDENDPDRYDDEGPRFEVLISHDFYLGVFQVTQAEYLRVVGDNPARYHPGNQGGLNHPVEMISQEEAVAFCALVGDLPEERAAGRRYRLPTESEWEHAARAGWDHTTLPRGRRPAAWMANFNRQIGRTVPVGSYPPTPWGLYDLSGNLWDWCADWYEISPNPEGVPLVDPTGPETGSQCVLRGGSWYGPARNIRCACRGSDSATARDHYFGFRMLLETS